MRHRYQSHFPCRACQYDLFSLAPDSNCPECGDAVLNSIVLAPVPPASDLKVMRGDGVIELHVGHDDSSLFPYVGAIAASAALAFAVAFRGGSGNLAVGAVLALVALAILAQAVASRRREECARFEINRSGLRIRRRLARHTEHHFWPHGTVAAITCIELDAPGCEPGPGSEAVHALRIRLGDADQALDMLEHLGRPEIDWLVRALRRSLALPEHKAIAPAEPRESSRSSPS